MSKILESILHNFIDCNDKTDNYQFFLLNCFMYLCFKQTNYRVVNETYDAETETRPRLRSDETETLELRFGHCEI